MKNLNTLFFLTLVLIIPRPGKAVVVQNQVLKPPTSTSSLSSNDLIELEKREIEEKIGRKLKLKEKIVLRLINAKKKKLFDRAQKQSNEKPKTDGFAITGFVGSLVGFLGLIVFSNPLALILGLCFGIFSIIFSIIALKRIKQNPELKKGKFLALIGLFLGSTLLLIAGIAGIGYLM